MGRAFSLEQESVSTLSFSAIVVLSSTRPWLPAGSVMALTLAMVWRSESFDRAAVLLQSAPHPSPLPRERELVVSRAMCESFRPIWPPWVTAGRPGSLFFSENREARASMSLLSCIERREKRGTLPTAGGCAGEDGVHDKRQNGRGLAAPP